MKKLILTKKQKEVVRLMREGAKLYQITRTPAHNFLGIVDILDTGEKKSTIRRLVALKLLEYKILSRKGKEGYYEYSLTDFGKTTNIEKRKRIVVDENLKVRVYEYYKQTGGTMIELQRRFGVGPSCLSRIISEKMLQEKQKRDESR